MKLNQVIAVERGLKGALNDAINSLYALVQKPDLFSGFTKVYVKKTEGDVEHPPQAKKVQTTAENVLKEVSAKLAALFDITAQKDWANCDAKADVKVGDKVIASAVPSTFLLFLSKRLTDMETIVGKLPVLDPSEDWSKDVASGLFKTGAVITNSTKKVQKALVLYPHQDKHPAQTQLITEDEVVGQWNQTKFSGALTQEHKDAILKRIQTLSVAVKKAREEANLAPAPERAVGNEFMTYILGGNN